MRSLKKIGPELDSTGINSKKGRQRRTLYKPKTINAKATPAYRLAA